MFTKESLEVIEAVDKHVSNMNSKVKYPYYFSWSMPTNHRHTDKTQITYICVRLGKYLIQETKERINGCTPVEITYFFGQVKSLEKHCTVAENIADLWNEHFTKIVSQNYFALDNAARGYHNPNNAEFPELDGVPQEVEEYSLCSKA